MSHEIKPCDAHCDRAFHPPEEVRRKGASCEKYNAWLNKQAKSCQTRDPDDLRLPISEYRTAIHKAVEKSKGLDAYTGDELEWNRLNNPRSETEGRRGHIQRSRYPSVDHYQGPGKLNYKICSGVVNHAKGALDHQQFVDLCRRVARHHETWGKPTD